MTQQHLIFDAYAQGGQPAVVRVPLPSKRLGDQVMELVRLLTGTQLPVGIRCVWAADSVVMVLPAQHDFEEPLQNLARQLQTLLGGRPVARSYMTYVDYLGAMEIVRDYP